MFSKYFTFDIGLWCLPPCRMLIHRCCNSVPDSINSKNCFSGWVQISLTVTLSAEDTLELTPHCVYSPNSVWYSELHAAISVEWIYCRLKKHIESLLWSSCGSLRPLCIPLDLCIQFIFLCVCAPLCATVQTSSAGIQWCASSIMVP